MASHSTSAPVEFELGHAAKMHGYVPVTVPIDSLVLPPGEVEGKQEGVEAWVKSGRPLAMPMVGLGYDDRLHVIDGRHRIMWLKAQGYTEIPVAMNKEEAGEVQAKNLGQAQGKLASKDDRKVSWNGYEILLEAPGGGHRETGHKQTVPEGWLGIGEFKGLVGRGDKDLLDVVLGPNVQENSDVYMAVQLDGETFRQFKILIGFNSEGEAEAAYQLMWKPSSLGGLWRVSAKEFVKRVLPRITTKVKKKKEASFTKFALKLTQVSPHEIVESHPVKNPGKKDRLTLAMAEGGWQGRPILAYQSGDNIKALTGSHRLAAARQAGLDNVPVLLIETDDFPNETTHVMMDNAKTNYARLEALDKVIKVNPEVKPGYELMLDELVHKHNLGFERKSSTVVKYAHEDPEEAELSWKGYPIVVEHEPGDVRHPENPETRVVVPEGIRYGYFPGILGDDGDNLDAVLGSGFKSRSNQDVHIAIQTSPEGAYQQLKVFLGFPNETAVKKAFCQLWPDTMYGGVWTVPAKQVIKRFFKRGTLIPEQLAGYDEEWRAGKTREQVIQEIRDLLRFRPHDARKIGLQSMLDRLEGEEEPESILFDEGSRRFQEEERRKLEQWQVEQATRRKAAKPKVCPNCGATLEDKDVFGSEGRYFHRGCTNFRPIASSTIVRFAANVEVPPAMMAEIRMRIRGALRYFALIQAQRKDEFINNLAENADVLVNDLEGIGEGIQELEAGNSIVINLPLLGAADPGCDLRIWRFPDNSKQPNRYSVFLLCKKEDGTYNMEGVSQETFDKKEAIEEAQELLRARMGLLQKMRTNYEKGTYFLRNKDFIQSLSGGKEPRRAGSGSDSAAIYSIPLDIADSRYADVLQSGIEFLPKSISLFVYPTENKDELGTKGSWDDTSHTIRIYLSHIPTDQKDFDRVLPSYVATAEHELVHAVQSLIGKARGLIYNVSEGKDEFGLDVTRLAPKPGGLPAKKYDPEYNARPHAQRDLEFYANLVSEVRNFERSLRPAEERLGGPLATDEVQAKAQIWIDDSPRFRSVKEFDESRWRKMVKEFMRLVLNNKTASGTVVKFGTLVPFLAGDKEGVLKVTDLSAGDHVRVLEDIHLGDRLIGEKPDEPYISVETLCQVLSVDENRAELVVSAPVKDGDSTRVQTVTIPASQVEAQLDPRDARAA